MKTERELLELAAKAAGLVPDGAFGKGLLVLDGGKAMGFDPLNDDGDALRLAVTLGIETSYHHEKGLALAVVPGLSRGRGEYWHSGAPMEAMRLAIVHAAAAIQLTKEAPDGQWKCGNEYLPYHPDASQVEPAYRDGWNDCYQAAQLSARQAVPDEVLRDALVRARDWFESQAKVVSKGCGSPWNLMQLRDERDAADTALSAAPPPPEREPHPPTRHCMCADCAPSFNGASDD